MFQDKTNKQPTREFSVYTTKGKQEQIFRTEHGCPNKTSQIFLLENLGNFTSETHWLNGNPSLTYERPYNTTSNLHDHSSPSFTPRTIVVIQSGKCSGILNNIRYSVSG